MATGLTLDAGALIAADKGNRAFWALWAEALDRNATITIPAPVLAQVWRGNNPIVARLLRACIVEAMDATIARRAGVLLGVARTRDVVDATVVVSAAARGDAILTTDPGDIEHLTDALGAQCRVVPV